MKTFHLLFLTAGIMTGHAADSGAPPEMPRPVASFGAAATADGNIFIYGGHAGAPHRYNRADVSGEFYSWHAGLTKWKTLPAGEPAQGASLVVVPGGLARIGGMAARNASNEDQDLWSSETAARYDLGDGQWHDLPTLPERRSSHDSTAVGGRLYVIGGWAMLGGKKTQWHDHYLTLDLNRANAQWESHPQPFKRRALAVQAVGARIYVIGGMDSDNEITSAVEVLDTSTGLWTKGPSLPNNPLGGFGFATASVDGRLFANGMEGSLLELRDEAWVPVAKLGHPRYFHRLVAAAPGKLVALGGVGKDGKKVPPEVIAIPPPGAEAVATNDQEADWPRYQGPRGDCTTPETGWSLKWSADGPPLLWKAEVGRGLSSFAVAGDRAFTVGNDGNDRDTLWCFDLNTGKVVWKYDYPAVTRIHEMSIVPYGPAATPAVADGKVWAISRDGLMQCVNSTTGELVWRKHLVNDLGGKRPVYGYAGSPAIFDGRLYADVGGSGGSNACLNAATGEVIWQTGSGEAGYSTPFVRPMEDRSNLVIFKGEALEIRSAEDGRLVARHATETRDFCNCATPVVVGDLYFISHTGNMGARVLELKGSEFDEKWTDRDFGLLFHSGMPWQGHLLAFNDQVRGENDLRLIDLKSGKIVWKNSEIEKGTGLLADDGHALLLTNRGELVLAKIGTDGLDIQQRAQILSGKCWVQPALSHRRLLCRNNDGSVVCLDLR